MDDKINLATDLLRLFFASQPDFGESISQALEIAYDSEFWTAGHKKFEDCIAVVGRAAKAIQLNELCNKDLS